MNTVNNTFNADLEAMVASAREAFQAAQHVIDTMKDGERIQIKDLAKDVGLALALDPKQVLGFVNHFAHNSSTAYVTRGKNGGIIKGVKPIRTVKISKKKAQVVAAPVVAPVADACNI
jgi:ribosomal protein S4E